MREGPTPSLCPCCAGKLAVVLEIYETIKGRCARAVRVCTSCNVKVAVHRMPREFRKVPSR